MTNGTGGADRVPLGYVAMQTVHRPPRAMWLSAIGVVVTTAPLLQQVLLHPARELPDNLWAWFGSIGAFLVADLLAARSEQHAPRLALLAVASLAACTAIWLIPVIYGGAALTATLLVVVAARMHPYPRRAAYAWIVLQSLVLLWIYTSRWNGEVGGAATFGFFCFQIIGYRFSSIAASEHIARMELKEALDALSATRSELTAAARRAERNQIAADLHDVLGHHLVALQLQLEAANTESKQLVQARQLARLLLAEVRGVVDELQDRDAFEFAPSLQHLTGDDTKPTVQLEILDDSGLARLPNAAARECFRAVQEAVTNARKHADATSVTIHVAADALTVRDDGHSWTGPVDGRGMQGMANRCHAAGCTFELRRAPETGTTIVIGLPRDTTEEVAR